MSEEKLVEMEKYEGILVWKSEGNTYGNEEILVSFCPQPKVRE